MVSELVRAFHATSTAMDEAIEANDSARIGEIDRQLSALWDELLAVEPKTKAEARELVVFLLHTLAPTASASEVQTEALSGILRLFEEHCHTFEN
ncbi:MAG: hypothetical protein CMJ42_02025 [Phyllobacteriaceae bacterium]|nr:hypothetical protein [Phyllobacteriaceae bacterium]MBA90388.1 hypothetical protein [Phyllobacteriaceae bacterium]|tara:strand:+ start:602 stop:886 length:285 start_codon:yes stop_codon:yes gene_type:complete